MPASKNINIKKVAAAAGVSPATVSRYINQRDLVNKETCVKIEQSIQALGYVVSSYAKKKTSNSHPQNIIVINCPQKDQFYLEVTKGIETAAIANDYFYLNSWFDLNESNIDKFIIMLTKINASGTILLNPLSTDLLNKIENVVPVVQCCEYSPNSNVPYVTIDDFAAARQATNFLISLGRKKIGFVGGGLGYKFARERLAGYRNALETAGLPLFKQWELLLPENKYSLAYTAVINMFQNSKEIPDALFATSDFFAIAVIKAAAHCGYSVPKDIMVIGFDDIEFSSMTTPALSTVMQPTSQIGYTACTMLIQRIHTNIIPKSIVLGTELVIRESSFRPVTSP